MQIRAAVLHRNLTLTLTYMYMTFEPQIKRLLHSVEDYFCAKFQVIPIRSFRFIMLAYTPTPHTYTHRDSDRYIRAAVLRHRRG